MEVKHEKRELNDGLVPKGFVEVWAHDAVTGELVDYISGRNIVTDAGFALLCDMLAEATSEELLYVAAGEGTTAAAAGDTSLQTERWRGPIVTKERSGSSLVVRTFLDSSEANGYTLTEFGILTASSAGTLFNRVILSPGVAKDATKTLTIQVTISLTR